jgi:hypothetical protein
VTEHNGSLSLAVAYFVDRDVTDAAFGRFGSGI